MRSRPITVFIASVLLAAAVFIVAFMYFRFASIKGGEEGSDRTYSRYYVMITDDYRSSFWQSVHQGAMETAAEKDVYVELFGSNLAFDYTPEELMEMAVAAKVDGIMVYGSNQEDMTELIDEAVRQGIPVVTMFTDIPDSVRCSFVGVSGYSIGLEYGRQILSVRNEMQRLSGSEAAPETLAGKVNTEDKDLEIAVFFDDKRILYDQNVILSGIKDGLSQELSAEDYAIKTVAVDSSNPFSVEESIRDVFMGEEIPDVLVCLSELDTTCAYQAAIDFNLVGRVYILGYYNSDKILNAISRNVVFSSLAVNAEDLGRYGVEALDEYVTTGNTNQYFTADLSIIDRNNVGEYLHKEGEDEK